MKQWFQLITKYRRFVTLTFFNLMIRIAGLIHVRYFFLTKSDITSNQLILFFYNILRYYLTYTNFVVRSNALRGLPFLTFFVLYFKSRPTICLIGIKGFAWWLPQNFCSLRHIRLFLFLLNSKYTTCVDWTTNLYRDRKCLIDWFDPYNTLTMH